MSHRDPQLRKPRLDDLARHSRRSPVPWLLFAACCLCALGLSVALAASGGQVRVEVVSEETELPISGIFVEVLVGRHLAVARTAANGVATIPGVPAGMAMVRTRPDDPRSEVGGFAIRYAPGVEDPIDALRLAVEDASVSDFGRMAIPVAGRIKAQVVRPEGGPWPHVPVVLRSVDGSLRRQALTGQEGRVTFGGLEAGNYRLWVDAWGTDAITEASDGSRDTLAAEPIVLSHGELVEGIELAPDLGARILGAVREEVTNFGIPGIAVRIFLPGESANPYSFITDALGIYLGWGLPTGSYNVYVPAIRRYYPDAETENEARAVRVVEPEEQIGIDLRGRVDAECRLPPLQAGVIEGRLKGVDFATLENARIVVWSDEDTISQPVTEVGAFFVGCLSEGIYRAAFVPEGHYRTQYHPKTNLLEEAALIVVTAGDTAKAVDFEPDPAVAIGGRIVAAADGIGIEGMPVRGHNEELGLTTQTTTDGNGAFQLDRLMDGTGLPAGSWEMTTDSLTIPKVDTTPIRTIGLEAEARGSVVLFTFRIPLPKSVIDWRLLQKTMGGETVRLVDADTHPEGLHARSFEFQRFSAPAAFRLEVERFVGGGAVVEQTAWVRVDASPLGPRHPFPHPWDGRTDLQLGNSIPEGEELILFGMDGRRLGTGIVKSGSVSLEVQASLPSGIYFLQWRDSSGLRRVERLVLKR